jgi:DNA polymerase-3 subunit gamma/tau
MRDALSIYDRVVSFSGKELTRQAVTENLNVLDYDSYLSATELVLQNDIPQLLMLYNEILSHGFDGHHFIAGLASHFRDLLVCQNPKTIALLEVGENTKALYFAQAQKASAQFLLKGIELANECDLQYKSSRNQRLLVELCLMQLASLTFGGEKKKDSGFIVPPSQFTQPPVPAPALKLTNKEKEVITGNEFSKGNSAAPKEAQLPTARPAQQEKDCAPAVAEAEPEPLEKPKPTEVPKPEEPVAGEAASAEVEAPSKSTLDKVNSAPSEPAMAKKKVSGLSLKSIQKKKELEAQKRGAQEEEVIEKNGKFSEEEMQEAWMEFANEQSEKGEKILASIMQTDTPVLKGKQIWIELPNETMKLELEKVQYYLMGFLKERLQNTHLQLQVSINEKAEKKFAFTPIEKFEKLKEKNPLLEKLRSTFDLDI